MSENQENQEKRKPKYYDFLKRLLSQKRLNKETVEDVLNQYCNDPDGFEADFYSMHRYLLFMDLRAADADYISLAFHSQLMGRPQHELANRFGIGLPTALSNMPAYPYAQGQQQQYPRQQVQPLPKSDEFDIKEMMKLKQQMEIMKEIFKEAEPAKAPQQDQMSQMLPFMMMMNPNMQVQAKMGKDAQGNDVIQGFTVIPSTATSAPGSDLVTQILGRTMAKSDKMEEILLGNLMGTKDEKIAKLEQKVAQVSETRGSDYMLDELKRFQEFQRIMNPQGASGDPQVAMQLQDIAMKHDREMAQMAAEQEQQRFQSQLALREYVDTRKEKMAQMQMAEKALGALSDNVGKIVTEVGAPLASAASEGVADVVRQTAKQSTAAQGSSGQQPKLNELSNDQIAQAIQKAQEMEAQSAQVQTKMQQYKSQFSAELQRRASGVGTSAPVTVIDQYAEPEPLSDQIDDATGVTEHDGQIAVDIDPATFTVTE